MDLLSFHTLLGIKYSKEKKKNPQESITMNNANNFKSSATSERFQ